MSLPALNGKSTNPAATNNRAKMESSGTIAGTISPSPHGHIPAEGERCWPGMLDIFQDYIRFCLSRTGRRWSSDMTLLSYYIDVYDFLLGMKQGLRNRGPNPKHPTMIVMESIGWELRRTNIKDILALLRRVFPREQRVKNTWYQIWPILRILAVFCLFLLSVLPDILQVWVKKRFKSVSVSMPWSIPPALLVLWSVVWMFYDYPPIEDFQLDDTGLVYGGYYDDVPGVNFDDIVLSFPETVLAPAASPTAFLPAHDVHYMTQDRLPQLVAVHNNAILPLAETHDDESPADNPPNQATPSRTDTEHPPTLQRRNPKDRRRFTCPSCKISFTRKDNLRRHIEKKTCQARAESQVTAQSPAAEPGTPPPVPESRGNSRGVKRVREGTPVEEEGWSMEKELKKLKRMLEEERRERRRAEEQVDKLLDIIRNLSKSQK